MLRCHCRVKLTHRERAGCTCTRRNTRRRNWRDVGFQNRIHTYCSVALQTRGAAGSPSHTYAFLCVCVCVCVQVYVCVLVHYARHLLQGLVETPSVGVSEPLHGHWTQTRCSPRVRSSRHIAVRPDWSMSSAFQGVKVLSTSCHPVIKIAGGAEIMLSLSDQSFNRLAVFYVVWLKKKKKSLWQ